MRCRLDKWIGGEAWARSATAIETASRPLYATRKSGIQVVGMEWNYLYADFF
ncbi:MAG: hypothetical protein Q4G27_06095 [Flavobacteriaceae bacterium]|nr:hypothetical protein [Flavobacteriaceae bacterium]